MYVFKSTTGLYVSKRTYDNASAFTMTSKLIKAARFTHVMQALEWLQTKVFENVWTTACDGDTPIKCLCMNGNLHLVEVSRTEVVTQKWHEVKEIL